MGDAILKTRLISYFGGLAVSLASRKAVKDLKHQRNRRSALAGSRNCCSREGRSCARPRRLLKICMGATWTILKIPVVIVSAAGRGFARALPNGSSIEPHEGGC